MLTLIKNIKKLAGIQEEVVKSPLKGKQQANIELINNAYLIIKDGLIEAYGEMENLVSLAFDKEIDATNKFVLPAWCDSHSHIVYAANRENEFIDRIKGLTYQEIAEKGGGILNSAVRLGETSEDDLFKDALARLNLVMKTGTGAIEIKSGYGLSFENELKMLRVIKRLKTVHPITIKATLLAAHAIPAKYKDNRREYIDIILNEIIPAVAKEQLADYIDVFCETNYYTPTEMDEILAVGIQHGLKPKVHVNQFTSIGGIESAIKNKAISVDHLEIMTESDFITLKNSETIATVLPSCSFFLKIPYANARELIKNEIPLAIATDYNPGSTPSGNIPFTISLACIQQNLLPEEAINATTINGAFAMEVQDELGSITVGKKANLIITKEISSLNYIPYSFGENCVEQVILNGELANG